MVTDSLFGSRLYTHRDTSSSPTCTKRFSYTQKVKTPTIEILLDCIFLPEIIPGEKIQAMEKTQETVMVMETGMKILVEEIETNVVVMSLFWQKVSISLKFCWFLWPWFYVSLLVQTTWYWDTWFKFSIWSLSTLAFIRKSNAWLPLVVSSEFWNKY